MVLVRFRLAALAEWVLQMGRHEDNYKQDRQCTHNVTLRRARVRIVPIEKQYYIV